MIRVHIDFETRSKVDLPTVGAWLYSVDPSTAVLSIAYRVDDGPVKLIKGSDLSFDNMDIIELEDLAENPDVVFVAHNAFFEQCIWMNQLTRFGLPHLPAQRWRCTMAKAAVFSVPTKLEQVPQAFGMSVQKDMTGHKTMKKLSSPKKPSTKDPSFWVNDAKSFETLYQYNIQDVEVESELDLLLPDLHPREQEIWFMDQEINFRGIHVDIALVYKAIDFMTQYQAETRDEIEVLTAGEIQSPNERDKMLEFLSSNGLDMPDLQKATVERYLAIEGLDPVCRRILEIRQAYGKTSTTKFLALANGVDNTNCIREILRYYTASTGRWGGLRFQPQNLPRGSGDAGPIIHALQHYDYRVFKFIYPNVLDALSNCIRGVLIPRPGHKLLVADYNAIEARVVGWLADEQSILDVFRTGGDPYCHEASGIYGREITKDDKQERQVGKVSILALGYQGAINAFFAMSKNYRLNMDPVYDALWPHTNQDERESAIDAYRRYYLKADPVDRISEKGGLIADIIKQRWRKANQNIVKFWYNLEAAAITAVKTGVPQTVNGKVTFAVADIGGVGNPYHRVLLCQLPSGRCLAYHRPTVRSAETSWGSIKETLFYWGMKSTAKGGRVYSEQTAYGGRFAENLTQAVARDLLADAGLRLRDKQYPLLLNIHDEWIAEVLINGQQNLAEFESIMATPPAWALDLPIAVSGWEGYRYRKD